MKAVKLSSLKKGDYFTFKPIEDPTDTQIYERGDYDRSLKKYAVSKPYVASYWRYFKGDKIVYIFD